MGMTLFGAFQLVLLFGAFIFGRYSKKIEHYEDLRSKIIFISVDDAEMDEQIRRNAERARDPSLTQKERETAESNLKFDREINAYRQLLVSHGWRWPKPESSVKPQSPATASAIRSQEDDNDCEFPF